MLGSQTWHSRSLRYSTLIVALRVPSRSTKKNHTGSATLCEAAIRAVRSDPPAPVKAEGGQNWKQCNNAPVTSMGNAGPEALYPWVPDWPVHVQVKQSYGTRGSKCEMEPTSLNSCLWSAYRDTTYFRYSKRNHDRISGLSSCHKVGGLRGPDMTSDGPGAARNGGYGYHKCQSYG